MLAIVYLTSTCQFKLPRWQHSWFDKWLNGFHMTAMKQQSESDSSMFEDWSSKKLNWKIIRKLRIFGPNKRNLSKKDTRKKNCRVHYQYSLKMTK